MWLKDKRWVEMIYSFDIEKTNSVAEYDSLQLNKETIPLELQCRLSHNSSPFTRILLERDTVRRQFVCDIV